jgi:hypothetical protein
MDEDETSDMEMTSGQGAFITETGDTDFENIGVHLNRKSPW